MRAFASLYAELDATTRTTRKVDALAAYLRAASPGDAAWAVHFLSGHRPKRLVGASRLRVWAAEAAGLPDWMFEECYQAVGDLAETIALLLPPPESGSDGSLRHWVEERLLVLRDRDEGEQRKALLEAWRELDERQRFVWNKLLTGAFRVGVSQRLVLRALARVSGLDTATLAHRLMGKWTPSAGSWRELLAPDTADADPARPYPFLLAHPLDDEPETLGERSLWQVEWKWDGIRAQLVRRSESTWIWSRGEELVTERFPEVAEAARFLPEGTVLDGELLAFAEGAPLSFGKLQRRIGRKKLGPKILREVPVVLVAYDLLEDGGVDQRHRPLRERRELLEARLAGAPPPLRLSVVTPEESWSKLAEQREGAREQGAEGLMLKRRDSPYGVGRVRGPWWKWKLDPYSVDGVLIYAQRGHGRRASLYSDYTFAVWDGDQLVPFAKAYSGLTDREIREVDRFVRRHVTDRFGPVRAVEPRLVFELHFEGIRRSSRHKSGIAVRFPRMARWRRDKDPREADSLETVRALLPSES